MSNPNIDINVCGPVNTTISQYKTKFLKYNIPFASQVTEPNMKYVIKYDFDLGMGSVIIPQDCLLDFEGGSLSNGILVGNNTTIEAGLVKVFNTDITLNGTWNITEAYPEWFGAVGDGVNDDNVSIQKALSYFKKVSFQPERIYGFTDIIIGSNRELCGGGTLLYLVHPVKRIAYYPITVSSAENVSIHNLILDGNINNAGISDEVYVVCDTLTIVGNNIHVKDCHFVNAVDSAIMFSDCQNSSIENCKIDGASDLGIYVNGNTADSFKNNLISGCYIKNCVYGGISIKRNAKSVVVSNNTVYKCGNGIITESFGSLYSIEDVQITNNNISNIGFLEDGTRVGEGSAIKVANNVKDSILSYNKVHNSAQYGINIEEGENITIEGNEVIIEEGFSTSDVSQAGISVYNEQATKNCLISGNIVITPNFIAFNVHALTFGFIEDCIITGNIFIANASIAFEDRGKLKNTLLTSNVFKSGFQYAVNIVSEEFFIEENNIFIPDPYLSTRKKKGITYNRPPYLGNSDYGYQYYDENLGKPLYWNAFIEKFCESDGAEAGVKRSGTKAERPLGSQIYIGFQYYQIDEENGTFAIWCSEIRSGTAIWAKVDGTDPDRNV